MRGILLVNMGSPKSCSPHDVKTFIGEMLSDPYLTDLSPSSSRLLATKIIAPLSCNKSAKKYAQIWGNYPNHEAPLVHHMRLLAQTLSNSKGVPVEIGMRYASPSITDGLNALQRRCPELHEVVIFSLYPHYAQSTTQTMLDEIGRQFFSEPHSYRLKIVEPYYNHPAYIHALAEHIKPYLHEGQRIVFCYHSLPINQVEKGWKKGKEFDYVYQLKETNSLLAHELGIDSQHSILLYSSQRRGKWLSPFLNTDISDLPKLGWKNVVVVAPGFPIDNMETLYDIDIEARQLFMDAGGEQFTFVPSLNDSPLWAEAIWKISEKL